MIPQKRIILILLCNSVQNWMWDLSAFHDVFWTTCWIAAWRHSVIRLSWGDHYPLLTPYLCASPWIKFLTAACGKTGLRTEQCIVGDVVYLMRLDQRWSNKSELRLLKDSLLLAMWHSQPASKIRRGLATRVNGDLMFCKWQCAAAGEAKEASQTLVLSGNSEEMKGRNEGSHYYFI